MHAAKASGSQSWPDAAEQQLVLFRLGGRLFVGLLRGRKLCYDKDVRKIILTVSIFLSLFVAGCAASHPDIGTTPAATTPAATPVGGVSSPVVSLPETDDDEVEIPNFCETDSLDSDGLLTLTMVGIGDADCFLLAFPDGQFVLIDIGRKADFDAIESALDAKGVRAIDTLVLTHGHKDHTGGLKKLLERYSVDRICTAGLDDMTFSENSLELITLSGANHKELFAGERLDYGSVQIEVLAPLRVDPENENNNSLVLRVTYLNTAFLLMGDAEHEVEQELRGLGKDLRADVLKVGHHGENDATGIPFLMAVSPRFAAVTGDDGEDKETLSPEVLGRLRQEEIEIFTGNSFSLVDFTSDGLFVTAKAGD